MNCLELSKICTQLEALKIRIFTTCVFKASFLEEGYNPPKYVMSLFGEKDTFFPFFFGPGVMTLCILFFKGLA
jgi:hypothetical protein